MRQRTPRRSTRRDFLRTGTAAVAGAAFLGFPRVGRAQATELVLGTNGGTWYDHWYEGSFRHFEKAYGVKIVPFTDSSFSRRRWRSGAIRP